ncbi:YTH domain-containing family protein 2-like isoform X1 [Panicum miliaceum]|uniref:YTH domain-containing family protein n=1 Tax=Panicum miliaceum TaxID=4540 RepID=A0A3L6TGT5_PANMI|nr:YTH domain-containing family protein 2-like isoform X1 [Panicum miliaceum]
MATVAPAPTVADQATNLMQKLSLESTKDGSNAAKKPSGLPYGSANAGDAQSAASQVDRSITPLLQEAMDPNFFYQPSGYASPAYYYPSGYDGSANEWDSRYAGHEGMEMPPQSVYGDMYHGYGYAPYGPYPSGSPVPTAGHDVQSYGSQQYQYPTQYYQSLTSMNATHGVNGASSQPELPFVVSDQTRVLVDATKASANVSANGMPTANNSSLPRKQAYLNVPVANNGSYGRGHLQSGGPSASNYGHSGLRSPAQWYDGPVYSNGHQRPTASSTSYCSNSSSVKNQSQRPTTNLMGMHAQMPSSGMGLTSPSYPSRMYPDNRLFGQYGQYGNTLKGGLGFGSNVYNSRNNGRWGVVDTKYKPRGRALFGFGGENQDGFTELNRGPRSGGLKHQKQFGPTVTIAVKGQALPSAGKQNSALPDKGQYNQEGFPVAYKDAKFFVIKSYSEDDVHKSIKYNVWASTPNGNKKLDAGYREAQEKSSDCPVFLFFSVNTSGQFVGVAEMVGPVDFDKTVEYWQQDKWNGCFPLKWHIVKDVPNNILKHITLDNNDNKPVTNSRDTQEVKLEQGLEMLKIFKEHVTKTSILDDFGFYENRQKLMQEKRAKQQSLQGQASTDTASDVSQEKDKDATDGKPGAQKHVLSKEGTLAEEAANASKPVTESGVSNGN